MVVYVIYRLRLALIIRRNGVELTALVCRVKNYDPVPKSQCFVYHLVYVEEIY